jgi:hypothetical protein
MSVCNCKVKFIRPEYNNLKKWCEDENNVYIGRRGVVFIKNENSEKKERFPKDSSIFCNPFKVGKHGTREEIIKKYEKYIKNKIQLEPELKDILIKMKNKNLGCWCYPEKCHGDVLINIINNL